MHAPLVLAKAKLHEVEQLGVDMHVFRHGVGTM